MRLVPAPPSSEDTRVRLFDIFRAGNLSLGVQTALCVDRQGRQKDDWSFGLMREEGTRFFGVLCNKHEHKLFEVAHGISYPG
jgi:hypothetical protein